MNSLNEKIVCVTGASSGIGTACAVEFARHGAALLLVARRGNVLEKLATQLQKEYRVRARTLVVDVRNQPAVEKSFASLSPDWSEIDVLVNNAGLSRGLSPLHEGVIRDWDEMIDTNVKGLLYVSRAVLPGMVQRNRGHILNIGSISGHQTYPGGNVYSASKFAVVGLTRGLRMDLLGTAVRVSIIDPGLVQTDFSNVRFRGDTERAEKVYQGYTPLRSSDIAEIAVFCATRPPHVTMAEVMVLPTDQASVGMVHKSL